MPGYLFPSFISSRFRRNLRVPRFYPCVLKPLGLSASRAQLHRRGGEVRLFSRDLNDVSGGYPEVVAGALDLAWDGILDGELLAWRDGTVLPFLTLQTRLGRKRPTAAILAEVPVIFVAWDALVLGPRAGRLESLLELPLTERRTRLEALDLPLAADGGAFALSHLVTVESVDGLEGRVRGGPCPTQ